jgi:dihydrodipicolinate synthase/N-acetylneuraminate lyase
MNIHWQGVFPAVTTPFRKNEQIDFDEFSKNIEAQIAAGCNGIILCGTLGEASTLLGEEKLELLEEAVKTAARRVPVLLNIAEQRTGAAVAMVREAEKRGASGLMLLPPLRYAADSSEAMAYIISVAEATSLPIMLYNNPADYKIEITLPMFERLSRFENIQAVKESTRDVSNTTRMINAFGERYKILCGVDTIALESLLMGASGWVAGLVCAFPSETVAIYKLVHQGRLTEARALYRWFFPLLELDIHPKLVQYIKLAQSITGLGTEHVRKPRLKLEGEERKHVLAVISNALAERPTLPNVEMISPNPLLV